MKIVALNQVPKTIPNMSGSKDIFKQIPISKADGTPSFSIRVFSIEPGGHTPFHSHPFEHLNYIIRGEGVIIDQGGEHTVREGDFALVMPGELHQYKNDSDREMIMICSVPKEYE